MSSSESGDGLAEENARRTRELNEKFRQEHPKEYDGMDAFQRALKREASEIYAPYSLLDDRSTVAERRRYALLAAAATLYDVDIVTDAIDAVTLAHTMLAEIERREKP